MARDRLLEPVSCSAWWEKEGESGHWTYGYDNLQCPYKAGDPDEYWGDLQYVGADIVSSARKYPWMPSDKSIELPY